MKRGFATLALALCIAACGGGDGGAEDFTVDIARAPVHAITPFLSVDLSDARDVFPGLKVTTSRLDDGSILYTIPASGPGGSDEKPTVIRLTFESLDAGKATRIHAAVDVSDTLIIEEGSKQLDEAKINQSLKGIVNDIGKNVALRSPNEGNVERLAMMLAGISVISNGMLHAQANEMRDHPERAASRLAARFGGFGMDDMVNSHMDRPADEATGENPDPVMRERRSGGVSGKDPTPSSTFGQPDMPDPNGEDRTSADPDA